MLRDQVRGDGGFTEDGKCGYEETKAKGERLKKNPEDTSAKTLEMPTD